MVLLRLNLLKLDGIVESSGIVELAVLLSAQVRLFLFLFIVRRGASEGNAGEAPEGQRCALDKRSDISGDAVRGRDEFADVILIVERNGGTRPHQRINLAHSGTLLDFGSDCDGRLESLSGALQGSVFDVVEGGAVQVGGAV